MPQEQWTAVDDYLCHLFVPHDPALEQALEDARRAGLPPINVTANQGKLLSILARGIGARSILEIGTLAGYSTIWLARALPENGSLVTLELDPKHAEVARKNLDRAGAGGRCDIRIGPATDSLARLAAEARPPFDLVFIDADKESYPAYLEWSLKLTRPGSLIIADNVVRKGAVADPANNEEQIRGIRQFLVAFSSEPRVVATAFQTVSDKGHDGFAMGLVTSDQRT